MASDRERIRRAIDRALAGSLASRAEPKPSQYKTGTEADGELPSSVIAKVPRFLSFLVEFANVMGDSDPQPLIQLVTCHRELVFDSDFFLYMTSMINRNRRLGQVQEADVRRQLELRVGDN